MFRENFQNPVRELKLIKAFIADEKGAQKRHSFASRFTLTVIARNDKYVDP